MLRIQEAILGTQKKLYWVVRELYWGLWEPNQSFSELNWGLTEPFRVLRVPREPYFGSHTGVSGSHTGVLESLTSNLGSHTVYLRSHFGDLASYT